MNIIETIARAVIIKDNKILLCKSIGSGHYFLPGGHVEFGEEAEKSLAREMKEELRSIISDLKFIGISENYFGQDNEIHHEVNLIYSAKIENADVSSAESHLAFEWQDVNNLANIKFIPREFAEAIIKWNKDKEVIYVSTMDRVTGKE